WSALQGQAPGSGVFPSASASAPCGLVPPSSSAGFCSSTATPAFVRTPFGKQRKRVTLPVFGCCGPECLHGGRLRDATGYPLGGGGIGRRSGPRVRLFCWRGGRRLGGCSRGRRPRVRAGIRRRARPGLGCVLRAG